MMAEPTAGDSLSAVWQGIAAFGLLIGGIIAAFIGVRKKSAPDDGADSNSRLQAKLDNELLRRDLEQVFRVHREAVEERLRRFEEGIHEKLDGLSEERRRETRDLDKRVRDLETGRHQR